MRQGFESGPEQQGLEWDALAVARVFGMSRLRVELMQHLRASGGSTAAMLARNLECTRNGLSPHLETLEAAGLVRLHIAKISGTFRPTRIYELDRERAEAAAWGLFDLVVGDQLWQSLPEK